MKNIFTALLCLLFLGFVFTTTTKAQGIDGDTIIGQHIIASRFDEKITASSDWASTDSTIYFYNDQEQVIEKINLSYEDNEWIPSSRSLFHYSAVINEQIETFQWWREGKWVNRTKIFLEKDDTGNIIRRQLQEYKWFSWRNVNLNLRTYNSNGQLLSALWQSSFDGGKWANRNWNQYEYDLQGNLVYESSKEFIAGEWVNQNCNQYEYDLQGNLVYENSKEFIAGEWMLQVEEEYTYEANQQLKIWVTKLWEDGRIYEEIHCKHEIDAIPNGFIASEFFLENNIWELSTQETYLFNNQNHLILHQKQGVRDEILVNISKDTFLYHPQDLGKIEELIHYQGNSTTWKPKRQISYTYNDNNQVTVIALERFDSSWYLPKSLLYEFDYSETGVLIEKIVYTSRINEGGWAGDDIIYFRNISHFKNPLSVSLEEFPNLPTFSLSIFPNPTQNHFFIQLNKVTDKLSLKIFNKKGQLVKEDVIQGKLIFVPTTGLTKGTYFVHLTDGQQQIVRKISIQ